MTPSLGIVGGLGPEGTVHYYRKLVAHFGAEPLERRPTLLVDHVWIDGFSMLLRAGDEEAIVSLFGASFARLHRAGASAALISAVTPHKFLARFRRVAPLPIVDLVAATRDDVVAAGYRTVALLGTRVTLVEPFFRSAIEEAGVRVVGPDEEGIRWLDELIFGALARGTKTAEMRRRMADLVARTTASTPVDAIVVACTDLMDLIETRVPLLDPIDSHVRAAARALAATPSERG